MGLIQKTVDKAVGKSLDKIRLSGNYEYDTILAPNQKDALRDRFTRSMYINSIWYGGCDIDLKRLYEEELKKFKVGRQTTDELNYFWAQPTAGLNVRKIHSGLPQLISEKMVDLLLSNGYEYTVYVDDKLEDEDEENKKRLDMILEDNSFDTLLPEAIETESWAGGVAFKLSYSDRFPYPIIEVIQPEEYEATIEAGRITEDKFITYYNRNNSMYKLKEIYGYDEKGGYIKYELTRKIADDWFSVELSELEETKDLKTLTFNGFKDKFSLYKPNKLPNSEFRGSRLGESDYAGSQGVFDAIDEVLSTWVQEFRDAKINKFWPDNLLPKDPISGVASLLPSLKKDFITYVGGIGEKEKPNRPEMIQGDIHSEKYVESFKKLIETALNNAGLSPQSIGITGLESVSASEESQELREKTSIRTREKKLSLWTETLNKLDKLLLVMDDFKNGRTPQDYYTRVVFNDYKIQTVDDKTTIATKGIAGKAWSIKSAVEYVHDEMTPEEQILMVVNIKIENGINIFTKEEEEVYKKYVMELQQEQESTHQEPQTKTESMQSVKNEEVQTEEEVVNE